ncbi:MAG TPA: hypothetical protein VIK51_10620 [Vicinamibacteria bacterium]|jgi:hypothetical protein
MTTPVAPPLPLDQPLPFRQTLDEAVKQARRHFRRIYPYVAIPLALMAGLVPLAQGLFFRDAFAGAGSSKAPDVTRMMVDFGTFGVVMLAFMVVSGLSYGAMFAAATDALSGREISMRRAWGLVVRPRVLGTLLLVGLAVMVGFAFCVLPGLYLGLLYAFTVPVVVAESRFGPAAMSRSAELARYNPQRQFDSDPRLHVFITVMVGTMLGYMINLLFQLPLIAFQQFVVMREVAAGHKADPAELMARLTWIQVPTNMLSMLTNTAVQLYVCFGIALLFFDLKRRKEGLDLEAAVASLVERHRARRQP